jgi:hypothetical protein
MLKSLYTEKDLQEIWERRLFQGEGLLTEDARPVRVEFQGTRSLEGGPDFRGARIAIGGVLRSGDVEIHLTPSGWDAHGHGRDSAYSGVILHVVLRRDAFVEPPRDPPLLVLEPHLAGAPAAAAPSGPPDLDALGEEWFEERRARIGRLRGRAGGDEALHRGILVALGYKNNQAAMAELARRRPFASLRGRPAGEIERSLREGAASLPRAMWRLRNQRPANHPWRRLAGMARFLAAAGEEGLARGLPGRATIAAMESWLDPDGTGQIGPTRAREIALNVFVPFLGPEAWRRVAESPPPALPGAAERAFGRAVTTVRRYFGALRAIKSHVPDPTG